MVWPTATVSTANLDAAGDSAASARADLKTAVDQLNAMRDFIDDAEVAMAVSGTVDIGGQASNRLHFSSGSGAITSLGTNYVGPIMVRVSVSCSLTYNATTLVTPYAANLTLISGDRFIAWPKGSAADGWVIFPMPGSGKMVLLGATADANCTLLLGRIDTSLEGGQIGFARPSDNTDAWAIDCFRESSGVTPTSLRFVDIINAAERGRFDTNGNFIVGGNADDGKAKVDIASGNLCIRTSRTPASAAASGNAGEICWDSSYVYVCTAANTWKRTAIATW